MIVIIIYDSNYDQIHQYHNVVSNKTIDELYTLAYS